ncbi:SH2 domain-containing protein 3C [Centruroides vittatus]|uniref:SH2 domain-containing protein 3C n=1 Tax=Centruroides vittatus TaxID=120091 RepID=UPI00350FE683
MEPMIDTEASPEELKKALEWELSLSNSDLRSHAWYHGTIPRQRAEELMSNDGDFLIRDCISHPGDYVLTCKWKNSSLHFVINKVVFQPFTVYEKVQYQFEEDSFDTVPDLVTYYVGNKRAVSAASGAIINCPVNRTMPLTYYASRYGLQCQLHYAALAAETDIREADRSPCLARRHSQPCEDGSLSAESHPGTFSKTATSSVAGFATLRPHHQPAGWKGMARIGSDPQLSPTQERDGPPPKPSRLPNQHVYTEPIYKDGNPPSNGHMPNINITDMSTPNLNPPSCYDLNKFATTLLQTENKPLESSTLLQIRRLLLENGPRILANHLTRIDLDMLKNSTDFDFGLGVVSGLELITLPQGKQLRMDLMERNHCLRYFVAVTILTCSNEEERANLVHKWIQIAIETKTALGNLYGFTAIMQGLALQQIDRLRSTWLTVRQNFTENAFTYETKLRPTLKSMQECSNPQAPNTCIPYLLSLITILQRHIEVIENNELNAEPQVEPSGKKTVNILSLGLQWEQSASDYGLQLLLLHLELGRTFVQQCTTYRRNGEIVLDNVKFDNSILDMFKTEFHLKFLWGSKGANVAAAERYTKFDQVLQVMSERCESS